MAIVAAIYAGHVVRQQINESHAQEASRLQRRENAARSTLPLTLSGISDYATNCSAELCSVVLGLNLLEPSGQTPNFDPIDPPSRLIEAIERMIEAAGDVNVFQMLAAMVREIQVLNARMGGLSIELACDPQGPFDAMRMNINSYILQCAVIYAQCNLLFDYARFSKNIVRIRVEWLDIYSAFKLMGIRENHFADLYAFCGRLDQQGVSPES